MSAIALDDDDDVEFQADLARAIAASLEPDLAGPHEEAPRGEASGWNALLAAGQAATWGSGLNVGRRSPAVLTVDDDDDDFQRQIAAAMAASIQSAEEERRRRELGVPGGAVGIHPLAGGLPVRGLSVAPPQGPSPQAGRLPSPEQQQLSLLKSGGSMCCAGGLMLKPLTAGRWPLGSSRQVAISASPFSTIASEPWPCSSLSGPGSAPVVSQPAAAAPMALDAVVAGAVGGAPTWEGGPGGPSGCPQATATYARAGPTVPACSLCSSAADSDAPGGPKPGDGATVSASRPDPVTHIELETAAGGGMGRVRSGLLPLSYSPAKHARTPSLAGTVDSAQPQMKRSRAVSAGWATVLSGRGGKDSGRQGGGRAASVPRDPGHPVRGPVAMMDLGGAGDGGCRGEKIVASVQPHSPPERPASAASGCTAPAETGLYAPQDGDCIVPHTRGDQQQRQGAVPPLPLPPAMDSHMEVLDLQVGHPPSATAAERCWVAARGEVADVGCSLDRPGAFGDGSSGVSDGGAAEGSGRCSSWPQLLQQQQEEEGQKLLPMQQLGHSAGGPEGHSGGSGQESGSWRYTQHVDLSAEAFSAGYHQHQRRNRQSCTGVNAQGDCEEREGSAISDLSTLQQQPHRPQQLHAILERRCCGDGGGTQGSSLASLELSRSSRAAARDVTEELAGIPGSGSFLCWSNPHVAKLPAGLVLALGPPCEVAVAEQTPSNAIAIVEEPAGSELMLADSSGLLQPLHAATAAAAPCYHAGGEALVEFSDGCTAAAGSALTACRGYSSADRRMLLHQRVWWWLGPGQVQTGRISSIDRRSEPLLYSVRLDADGSGAEGHQTIIATADCLFPYLAHGDKLMCRLPPSACDATTTCSVVERLQPVAARLQGQGRLEEWPGYGAAEVEPVDPDAGLGGAAPGAGARPCAWMCGTLQHCIFDGRVPMVHVLLGPDELPYSAPYEFVVPVSDAAEGSGCTPIPPSLAPWGQAAAPMTAAASGGQGHRHDPAHTSWDIIPVGRVA